MAAYFVRLHARWAKVGGLLAGMSYFIVYLLDLARLFSVSPTPAPLLLELTEIVGLRLSVPTMYWCLKVLTVAPLTNREPQLAHHLWPPVRLFLLFCGMLIVGLIVAIFTTLAAMGHLLR